MLACCNRWAVPRLGGTHGPTNNMDPPREVKDICRSLSRREIATTTEAKAFVLSRFGKTVHATTISRALRAIGMNAVAKKKAPLLTQRHRKLRLEFARKYSNITVADWKRVIWSNETIYRE